MGIVFTHGQLIVKFVHFINTQQNYILIYSGTFLVLIKQKKKMAHFGSQENFLQFVDNIRYKLMYSRHLY